MLTIRLQRSGKKNRSEFRIVLAEKESAASKKFTEILGSYNPRTKDFKIKQDRLQYWIAQHVTLSPTAHNLLVNQKLLDAAKVKAFSIPKKEPVAETPAAQASEAASETPAVETAEASAATTPVAEAPAQGTEAEAKQDTPTPEAESSPES